MYKIATDKNYTSTVPAMIEVEDWSEFVMMLVGMVEARDATDRVKKYNTPTISPRFMRPGDDARTGTFSDGADGSPSM